MAQNNVLQYVGARYVPVFYQNPNGTWDWLSGVQYEPLTIVKFGSSTYTSKKLVPATVGSPNTAPEYWALTGDYNGAIVELQTDVNEINSRLQNKKILWIGDSWSQGVAGGGTPFAQLIQSYFQRLGWTFNIEAYGGCGFVGIPNIDVNYLTLYNRAPNIRYDYIFIQGMANDYTNDALRPGIAQNAAALAKAIGVRDPQAIVQVLPISKSLSYDNGKACKDYESTIYPYFNVNVDMIKLVPTKSHYLADNIHLTEAGNVYLASDIMSMLFGGGLKNYYNDFAYLDVCISESSINFVFSQQWLKDSFGNKPYNTVVSIDTSFVSGSKRKIEVYPIYTAGNAINYLMIEYNNKNFTAKMLNPDDGTVPLGATFVGGPACFSLDRNIFHL